MFNSTMSDTTPTLELSQAERQTLMQIANDSIAYGLQHRRSPAIEPTRYTATLRAHGAAFVTLKLNGQLRGCIGSLQAARPLVQDVAENACGAAFRDPRFSPLGLHEMLMLQISLSILTPAVELTFTDEAHLLAQIQPGVDGLILEDGARRGTFLPAVWEQLTEPHLFWSQLKRKAGLAPDHWSATMRVRRYRAVSVQ